jgi:transposase-like protein
MQKPEEIELETKNMKLRELEDILANKELELVTTQEDS